MEPVHRIISPGEFEDDKNPIICKFCGGASCKEEDYLQNIKQPNAIEGLHSNWITSNILAMQRPSERLIQLHNIYNVFKGHNITTILNLQEVGEHASCGDGIIPAVGFSYIPENFSKRGINCFNESWEDMTATTFEHMMKIMNVFDMALKSNGKIAVHCHAGRGRTLLVICAWLIFHQRIEPEEVIRLAVEKRQGVLTKSSQRQFLFEFRNELQKRSLSFHKGPRQIPHTFSQYVEWEAVSHLSRVKKLLNLRPYTHVKIMEHLNKKMPKFCVPITEAFIDPLSQFHIEHWGSKLEGKLLEMKQQCNNRLQFQDQPRLLVQLLMDYYDELPFTVLTSNTVELLSGKNPLTAFLDPAVIQDIGVHAVAVLLDLVCLARRLKEHQWVYLRLAIMLLSKKVYFPKIFKDRKCNLKGYADKIDKLQKVLNPCIFALAAFLQQLGKQLPESHEEVDRLLFKARRIDTKVFHLTRVTMGNSQQNQKDYMSQEQLLEMYETARI